MLRPHDHRRQLRVIGLFCSFAHCHDLQPYRRKLVCGFIQERPWSRKFPPFADAAPEVTPASRRSVISVENLVHRYENRTALNGVSFDVRPAELFGLLGPNGSGKTTLFRILSTLMLPTAGRATIMGCDAAQEPARLRRQIGVVFQAQSVDLKLTAYENLWHQGHLYGLRGPSLKKPCGALRRWRWVAVAREDAGGNAVQCGRLDCLGMAKASSRA